MFLLIEILDDTHPTDISEQTIVDVTEFKSLTDAIIYVEPQNMEKMDCVIVDQNGEFGVIPTTEVAEIPALVQKWSDLRLASFFFKKNQDSKKH